ncbi:hypothetical protein EVAR_101172_1 [Eumeta japonica]|uniref:Uncharacterized protein n=1 Tax=Eumeta variegata TaxID=151549 RepID=A0A4C2AD14_EUMVA|nr:hypothetical protein EVAR_101172_1 [Eumeta japonica]
MVPRANFFVGIARGTVPPMSRHATRLACVSRTLTYDVTFREGFGAGVPARRSAARIGAIDIPQCNTTLPLLSFSKPLQHNERGSTLAERNFVRLISPCEPRLINSCSRSGENSISENQTENSCGWEPKVMAIGNADESPNERGRRRVSLHSTMIGLPAR